VTASLTGVAALGADELAACSGPVEANALAVAAALDDAGIDRGAVDAVLTYDSIVAPDIMQANRVAEYLGLAPSYAATVGSGGATPAAAVALAIGLVEAGLARNVVFAHADLRAAVKREAVGRMAAVVGNPEFEAPFGPIVPTLYSFLAQWLIESGRATREDLARIAVQTRAWATLNPAAKMRAPLTVEEVLDAPPVAGPLGRYDCCLITDFAGALVVSGEPGEVRILAAAGAATHEEILQMNADDPLAAPTALAAELYERAGIAAADLDLAYLYDSFTITTALQLLAYGLDRGEGLGALLADPGIGPGARLPVNTHGGLLSATTSGLFHLVEAVRQLRGEADDRQVDGARTALVTNIGGVFSNHAALVLGVR
jgi:acetyl-CoA acetyltransferase